MNVFTRAYRALPYHSPKNFTPSMASRASSTVTRVFSEKGVHPLGPFYSQATKANGFVFLAGQIPATPDGKLITGSMTEKAHKMCQNAGHVLEAAGSDFSKVVKVDVSFRDFNDFKEFNDVYAEYFVSRPARSAAEVSKLPAGADVMLDLVAVE